MEITFDLKKFLARSRDALGNPEKFYKSIEKEEGKKEPIAHAIGVSVVTSIVVIVQFLLSYEAFRASMPSNVAIPESPQLVQILPIFFITSIMVMLAGFALSGILFVWLKIWRIKATFWESYKIFAYSWIAFTMFSSIPSFLLQIVLLVYLSYVLSFGLSTKFGLKRRKSLILSILFTIISVILLVFVVGSFLVSATM